MKKVGIRLALAAATLLTSLGVQAGVLRSTVTFDPVDTSGLFFPPALIYGDEFYQSAFGRTMWFDPASNAQGGGFGDLVGAIQNGPCVDLVCPVNNATNYVTLVNDAFLAFGMADGFTFSVKSLDASFIGNGDPLPATPGFLALQGVRNGISTTAYYALSGPDANGKLNFGTINTGAFGSFEFDVVYAFAFACDNGGCQAFSTNRAQFALDNITVEHVPEPASLALVGMAGLAWMGARRRRATAA